MKIENKILKKNYNVSDESDIHKLNGHVGCALDFFEKGNTIGSNIAEIFSTHPVSSYRIKRAQNYAQKKGFELGECSDLVL